MPSRRCPSRCSSQSARGRSASYFTDVVIDDHRAAIDAGMQKFPSGSGLRAIALVVACGMQLEAVARGLTPSLDLFFAMSGFGMITATWKQFATPRVSLRTFGRRLRGLVPPQALAVIPIAAAFAIAPRVAPLLTVVWTLADGAAFCIAFAFVIAFDRRWCLPLLTAWGGLTLLVAAIAAPMHNRYLDVYANPLLIEFVIGAFAGYAIRMRHTTRGANAP